jgi:quercetin dioxygenase-like cupin family protein
MCIAKSTPLIQSKRLGIQFMTEDRRFFVPNRSLPFSAQIIGISFCTDKYHIQRKKSPYTVIEYVVDGEGYVMKDGEFQLVGKDKIYICPAEAPHDYYSSSERPWVKIWMNLNGRVPLALLQEYGFSGTVITVYSDGEGCNRNAVRSGLKFGVSS